MSDAPVGSGGQVQSEGDREGVFARAKSTLREGSLLGTPEEPGNSAATPVTAGVPAAPPRAQPVQPTGGESAQQTSGSSDDTEGSVPITLAEVEQNWSEIRHVIRSESRQVEALVNSSAVLGIEQGTCLVLEFASEFLSGKLEKEENRRIVEQALGQVLGKKCRVRATFRGGDEPGPVREPVGATADSNADDQGRSEVPATDIYQETKDDPVVQELVNRGGQVTDVQVLSDE
jgi:hypothetical protein